MITYPMLRMRETGFSLASSTIAKTWKFLGRRRTRITRCFTPTVCVILSPYTLDVSNFKKTVLVTGQLSKEIEGISEEIGRLFGVLDEDAVKLYP